MRNGTKVGRLSRQNIPGISHSPEIRVHSQGSEMGWLCLEGFYLFFFPQQFSFFLFFWVFFIRVLLLHQLSCRWSSSSLYFVASTCALCQCWVVVFACGGCCMLCVYMCMCVWCLKRSHLFLFWNPVSDHPSLPGWKVTALRCCELTVVLNLTLLFFRFSFLFQSCCVVFNFIYFLTIVSTCILWLSRRVAGCFSPFTWNTKQECPESFTEMRLL